MSTEVGTVAALKWLWAAVFAPLFWWLFKRQDKVNDQLQKVYTKEETEQQIELRLNPLAVTVKDNTEVMKELSAAITDLRVELAKINRIRD